jgi:hypothetical protein
MMRRRLRPSPTVDELAGLYARPHQHQHFPDHRIRVDVTSALAHSMLRPGGTVADLSCGDAAIARRLEASHRATLILGDYAAGYEHTGPIEETIQKLRWREADLFVCCETIEHLDDPDGVLAAVREKTDQLLLSTPDGEEEDSNPEHVWGWDPEDVEEMLVTAGFVPTCYTSLDLRPSGFTYCFQIWAAR